MQSQRLAQLSEDPNSFFLDASNTSRDLRFALEHAWDISLERSNAEVTVLYQGVRIKLSAVLTGPQLDELVTLHAKASPGSTVEVAP